MKACGAVHTCFFRTATTRRGQLWSIEMIGRPQKMTAEMRRIRRELRELVVILPQR